MSQPQSSPNSSRWYYALNGKAEGPVSELEIISGLHSGKFTLVDLVFREGEKAWCTLGEVPSFRDAFNALPLPENTVTDIDRTVVSSDESDATVVVTVPSESVQASGRLPSDWQHSATWVVLRPRDKGFEQRGPYTADQILSMIGSGDISYSQYAWKPGYKRWVRIGNLPEFDRRRRDREGDPVNQIVPFPEMGSFVPSLNREDLLGNVERVQRPVKSAPSAPLAPSEADIYPEEAMTGDLISGEAAPAHPQPVSSIDVARHDEPDQFKFSESAPVGGAVRMRPPAVRAKALRIGISVAIAAAFVVGALQWMALKQTARKNAEAAAAAELRQKRAEAASQLKKQVGQEAVSFAPPEKSRFGVRALAPSKQGARVLEIIPLKMTSTTPILVFQTDAPVGETIRVRLSAKTGDILGLLSYSKAFEVRRGPGEIASLELAGVQLPRGTYTVQAETGQVQSQQSIFVGLRDAGFEAEREAFLKSVSIEQQGQRKALYYGAVRLEKLAQSVGDNFNKLKSQPAKWKPFYATWKQGARQAALPVIELSKRAPTELAYPDDTQSFQTATTALANEAKLLDAAVATGTQPTRDVANTGSPQEIVETFKRIRQEAAKTSVRQ